MSEERHISPELDDTLARNGYFITGICNGNEMLSPGPGWFYVDIETALAYAVAWIYHQGFKDVKQYIFAPTVRQRRVARVRIYLRGSPGVSAIVAHHNFRFVEEKQGPRAGWRSLLNWPRRDPFWRGD